MAKALTAGRPIRRRSMFGFFDSDGWAWATAKASFWLLVIILTLGYIPDRAYYFVVSRTIDLGILGWSPVNLCPPENGAEMPCPVPGGAVIPWQASPAAVALPQGRTNGTAVQLGTNLLYIGGSDGSAPTATTYVSTIDKGIFGSWSAGPALPEARTGASIAILSGTAYLIGGLGPDGAPTDTVWSIGLDPDTSALGTWAPVKLGEDANLALPATRSGAAVVAVTDGIVVAGGVGADGKPTTSVWKSTLNQQGTLAAFKDQPVLLAPVTDASIALEGTFLWVYGGSDANGPTATVQRASYGLGVAAGEEGEGAAPSPSAGTVEGVVRWDSNDAIKLPAPRTGGAGFAANGALYLVGGSDGSSAKRELYWAVPDSLGNLTNGWQHLDATDLPDGIVNAAPLVTGSIAVIIGGEAAGGTVASSTRASLAPQEPFFRLGLFGIVVPALQIGGEIGQQLGYLAAAGVGTGNFVILLIVGWAFNHRPQIVAWRERRRLAREAKAPETS